MNPITALAFAEELSKSAAAPQILRELWGSGMQRGLVGAAAGGAAGYLTGPKTGDPEADRAARISRAKRWAMLGAGAGVAAPLVTSSGRQRAYEGTKSFLQKQRHGFVGGAVPAGLDPQAAQAGLTSLPGLAKNLVTRPIDTMRQGLHGLWHGGGRLGQVMTVGGLAMDARHLMDPNTPDSRAEKGGRLIGSTLGQVAGHHLPFIPGMLLSSVTGAVGGRIGRVIGPRAAATPENAGEQ